MQRQVEKNVMLGMDLIGVTKLFLKHFSAIIFGYLLQLNLRKLTVEKKPEPQYFLCDARSQRRTPFDSDMT